MKKSKRLISLLLAVLLALTAFAGTGMTALAKTGWVKSGGYRYYYANGEKIVNDAFNVDDKIYVFDAKGRQVTKKGWYVIEYNDGDSYEWQEWYFIKSNGTCQTGWKKIGGKWYYFDPFGGYMYSNSTYNIDGKVYIFDETGRWIDDKKGWYSVEYSDIGWDDYSYTLWYYFKDNGTCQTGWKKLSGKWYFFDEQYGWMYDDGGYNIRGKAYLFNKNGALITKKGWYTYKTSYGTKQKYYFNSKGKLVTGWKKLGGKKYYFDDRCMMATCITVDDATGKIYYFKKNGVWVKVNGWKKVNGAVYYFNKNGVAVTGVKKIGSKRYYFGEDGVRYSGNGVTEMFNIEEGEFDFYYINAKGVVKTGWIHSGDNTYYATKNGAFAKGWKTIGGEKYYFDLDDCHMYYGGIFNIDGTDYYFMEDGCLDND